jgi:hypothetical protein
VLGSLAKGPCTGRQQDGGERAVVEGKSEPQGKEGARGEEIGAEVIPQWGWDVSLPGGGTVFIWVIAFSLRAFSKLFNYICN